MSEKTKVLVVDDDAHIRELIVLYLNKEGFETVEAASGKDAVVMFKNENPQLVILDIMLPGTDGYGVCREIRRMSPAPIIMLTAKGDTFDKVLGLELGADDYMVKPFDPKEFIARVKAVLRRYESNAPEEKDKLVFPNLIIDYGAYMITYRGMPMEIPRKEFELLYVLAAHCGQVFTRDKLLDEIWGYEYIGDSRTVDVHMKRLRKRFSDDEPWGLKTVWGVGYKFYYNRDL